MTNMMLRFLTEATHYLKKCICLYEFNGGNLMEKISVFMTRNVENGTTLAMHSFIHLYIHSLGVNYLLNAFYVPDPT